MGRFCGFSFSKLVDGKLEEANVVENPWPKDEIEFCNWLFIDGRCEATDIFLGLVIDKEARVGWGEKRKPEEKYSAHLLLNHPELDGLRQYRALSDDNSEGYDEWFDKYFYVGIDEFKSNFDFDEAQKAHDSLIEERKENISECKKEIESLRKHQERAKTKVAFNCFEEKIRELKESILNDKNCINNLEEDDYDYDHYMAIKQYIEIVEKAIADHPDVIAVAFAED